MQHNMVMLMRVQVDLLEGGRGGAQGSFRFDVSKFSVPINLLKL